jgi:superoxide reductase
MTEKNQIYKCLKCGNTVVIDHTGIGELNCCEQPMLLLKENVEEVVVEKHLPIIEKVDGGILVKIGEVEHPMDKGHYIEWIEVIADNKNQKVFLKAGMKPEAFFAIQSNDLIVRAYCNLHGLWKVRFK